jgi:hypothetical protein
MLCGVPCVGTGMGAQGEVIGQFGIAIEAGSPTAFVKGINRILQLTPEKRAAMAQGARKHALKNYVSVLALQKYYQLYCELIGRQALAAEAVPAPEIDATVPVAPPVEARVAPKKKVIQVAELADPDSLEAKVAERTPEELPKWRREQEEARARRETELSQQIAASRSSGDVLQVFEAQIAKPEATRSPMGERARGVADEVEDLLAPEVLAQTPRPGTTPVAVVPAPANPIAAEPRKESELTLDEGSTLSLFPETAAAAATPSSAPSSEGSTFQLALLPDPPEELKRAG